MRSMNLSLILLLLFLRCPKNSMITFTELHLSFFCGPYAPIFFSKFKNSVFKKKSYIFRTISVHLFSSDEGKEMYKIYLWHSVADKFSQYFKFKNYVNFINSENHQCVSLLNFFSCVQTPLRKSCGATAEILLYKGIDNLSCGEEPSKFEFFIRVENGTNRNSNF